MSYTPREITKMAFDYLVGSGDRAFMVQLAHKHMYLFCGTVSY